METEIANKPQGEEEILAIDNDQKRISDQNAQSKNNKDQEIKEPPSSSIEFDKHQLFFHSQPNIMSYDTVTIKNTGKTCIYYQWQKNSSSFQLEEKRVMAWIDFFVIMAKIKYTQMKKENSLFHFFPKKMEFLVRNGYWLLPPLRDCNLNIHLNGLVHKYEDLYSEKINDLNKKIYDNSNNTKINEFLLDLIDTIREQAPPLPNMNNNKIFSFYFQLFNKEYNVEFSKTAMNNLNKLNNEVMNNILGIKEEVPVVTEEKPPEPPKEEVVVTEESKDGKNKKKEADKKE